MIKVDIPNIIENKLSMKSLSAIVLSFVMLITCFTGAYSAYAATTSVDDGVVCVEDNASGAKRYLFYPEALQSAVQKYPVIVWANGTGCQPSLYADLLKGFAKQGYIVVASDESMAADGKDQIAGLEYIIKQSSTNTSALYNKVDSGKITAMGHSQGGRSAVNAAAADKRFSCVVSIAGSNYQDEARLLKAPALFLTGTSDSIVSSGKWVKPAYDVCKGAAVYASLIDARHTTCCSEPNKYIGYCTAWMKAWNENDFNALTVFEQGGALAGDASWTDVTAKNLRNNIAGEVVFSPAQCTYDGKVKKPRVTVKAYNGSVISADNYTVTYDKGCKAIGKYKVTVNYCNMYTGTATAYFNIVPKGVSIKKLSAVKGGFRLDWNKGAAQITGYQLQYSTDRNFKKGNKTVTVKGAKKTSVTIKKLKSNKTYYVRIRTYKGKNYSNWSKVKTVKVK